MDGEMSQYRLWVRACEEFRTGIYRLTAGEEPGHGVYMTVREYFPPGRYNTMRETAYHLWWHGKHEAVDIHSHAELMQAFFRREEADNE